MTSEPRCRTAKLRTSDNPNDGALDHRLLLYALAAGSALACCIPTQAEVVFTPRNAVLEGTRGTLAIDLDNDGTTDFTLVIKNVRSFSGYQIVPGLGVYGNQPSDQIGAARGGFAYPLTKKTRISGGQRFQASASMETFFGYVGLWPNVVNRFLGVRFMINGEVHYGWIGFRKVNDGFHNFGAYLGGCAYETNPDTAIGAGDMGTGNALTGSIHPTSLEILAAGHTGTDERHKRTRGN